MILKSIFWSFVNKVVSHGIFRDIFQREFPAVQDPSQDKYLKDAFSHGPSKEYADLRKNNFKNNKSPVFITARFRSGSTLLWSILRQINELHCYYEPLNERMWFDKTARQDFTDSSHKGVDNYWEEYNHITNVKELFKRDWTYKRLLMDATSFDPNLRAHIEALITQSPTRPLLQFNRVDFRLPWLKANFQNAKIIHLHRHPRDQWISVSRYSIPINHDFAGHDLSAYNIFYTMAWARNLTFSFPFLDPSLGKHPYYYHYLLWRLSYIYGKTYSDLSVSYETLVTDAHSTLSGIIDFIGISDADINNLTSLIDGNPELGKWKKYADDEWYQTIEAECETLLQIYFT